MPGCYGRSQSCDVAGELDEDRLRVRLASADLEVHVDLTVRDYPTYDAAVKPATCGVKVADVHPPTADGQVTGTSARVVPTDPGASPPPVESYVEDRAPAGSFSFVGRRIRVRRLDGYTRRNDGEQEFSSRAEDQFACSGEGVERLFVVLPALWAATDTQPAAQAELRPRDDRLVLAYDAPDWQPGQPWKATWRMHRVSSREQLVEARHLLNERYRAAHPAQSADQPLPDASSSPAGAGARDDVLFAAAVGGLVLTAASTLAAAFGPGDTARVATFVSLIVVGVIIAAVLLKRTRVPRWRDVRRRPWLLAGTVALSLALVAIAVVTVTELTAQRESWQAQADGICWDYGNQYIAASGTALQQARTRLAVSQQALSALEQIEVPLENRPAFNSMLADKRQVIGYLSEEATLAAERKPTADVDGELTGYYDDVYQSDATALGLGICGQTTGRQ